MTRRLALTVVGALPVLWAGVTALPGRFTPAEVAGHLVAIGVAVLLSARWPAAAIAVALAAWEVAFLSRAEANSLLAAAALAAAVAGVALLAGRSPGSGHRDAVVLVLGPAVGAVAALVTSGEVDTAIGAAVGAAVLGTLPWTMGRHGRERDELVQGGWDRAARWEREAEYSRARERARLAAEMHDLLGHELAKAALQIGALEVDPSLDEPRRHSAGAARAAVTAAAERLADAVRLLRADADGRRPGAAELVERSAAAGLDVTLDAHDLRPHDPVVAETLSRVIAEALTNAMKHAPAAPVTVVLRDDDRGPELSVRSGPSRGPLRPTPGARLGLTGLGERVRLLGGTFTAGDEPDGGFRVTAALPRAPAAPIASEPAVTALERRRAEERVRRSGHRAVLVAAAVSAAGVGVVLAYMWYDAATSVLAPSDAAKISRGDPIAAVAPLLPARTRTDDPGGVPPEPRESTCRYYSTHANPFDSRGSDLHRVCVRDGIVLGVDLVGRNAPQETS